ncbi:sensor histidine kinase [Aquimarina sp. 2201CG1-2-11]|uniref:ATP-binding protein n=1 Tax=Aquimarina discodermiae TaxID=3231043 RepID=UPI0034635919
MIHKILHIIFFALFAYTSFAQSEDYFQYKKENEQLRKRNIESLEKFFNKHENSLEFKVLKWEYIVLKKGVNDTILHKLIKKHSLSSVKDSILQNSHLGKYYLFNNLWKEAHEHLLQNVEQAIATKDSLTICNTLNDLLITKTKLSDYSKESQNYIRLYKRYAYNETEKYYYNYFSFYFKNILSQSLEKNDSIQYQLELIKDSNCDFCLIQNYQRIAVAYNILEEELDSALIYNNRALRLINQNQSFDYLLQYKKGTLSNIARVYLKKENFQKAELYLKEAYRIESAKDRIYNDIAIVDGFTKLYDKTDKRKLAYQYLLKKDSLKDIFAKTKQAIAIKEITEKFNNASLQKDKLDLEKQQLETDKKRIINKNIYVILLISISALLIISVLIYRNMKRKQKLIESEREIQKQKAEKLLKDQELSSIDAMVEGQEKERQRIANELHDNLGGLLATLKLYVQNLKVKKSAINEQYDLIIKNTDEVLEEAYQKVRSIAQTRNAGVLTSEGLVPTIQNYAIKISASNSLIVEVSDYGMEQRLNNSMEITIFRIIQELITNVIKHANAKEITIDITNHQDSINIVVEDDGSGFDMKAMKLKKGMGLSSINKRIENLKGSLNIDTNAGKGTTIIIDIPLE